MRNVVLASLMGMAVVGQGVWCCASGIAAEARDPEAVRQTYTEVASRLDQGGDLMIVANVDGLLERLMSDITEIAAATAKADTEAEQARRTLRKLHAFLRQNGFYAVSGVGMSSVPRADGRNVVKMFIRRDGEAAGLPLWRACVGGAPRDLHSLRFMPLTTELVRAGTADIKQLWQLVKTGVAEVAPPQTAAQFAQGVAGVAATMGTSVDDVIASIGADSAVGVQFATDKNIMVPVGTNAWSIPSPSILIAMQVKDETIMSLIKRQLTTIGMPLTESEVEGTTLYSLALPVPVVPVELTLAQHDGFLLVGSTAHVVTSAITAYVNRGGLLADEGYKIAFAGQPVKHNGIAYVSDRFGEIIAELQKSALSLAPAGSNQDAASRDLLSKLINREQRYGCAITIMNYKSGVRASGISASSGQQLVASMGIAPVGVLAGIALPSLVKARNASRQAACINNLRQIDGAKEQWAMQQGKSDGAKLDMRGVCAFIKGATVPTCPAGGRYTFGVIGSDPTCTIEGHALP